MIFTEYFWKFGWKTSLWGPIRSPHKIRWHKNSTKTPSVTRQYKTSNRHNFNLKKSSFAKYSFLPADGVTVMFGLATCDVTEYNYESITCITSASSESNNTVTITVTNSYGALVPVSCTTDDCWFMFTQDATPTLTALHSPDKVRGSGNSIGSRTDAIKNPQNAVNFRAFSIHLFCINSCRIVHGADTSHCCSVSIWFLLCINLI